MKLVYFINESYYTINVNAVSNDSTNDGWLWANHIISEMTNIHLCDYVCVW
jgi:hypothetical protein